MTLQEKLFRLIGISSFENFSFSMNGVRKNREYFSFYNYNFESQGLIQLEKCLLLLNKKRVNKI